jgi:hypothetical protein
MKRHILFAAFISLLSTSAHAWFFFFIPGSLSRSASDAMTGAKGNLCVGEKIEVGHTFTSSSGNTAKVLSLSGTSSICQNPAQPIRAEIEFNYTFSSKAGIELSDDFKPGNITDLERFNGFLLKATSSSIREHGIQISATTKKPTLSLQTMANNIERSMLANQKFSGATSQNAEEIKINGMPAVRFEISATIKGMFGSKVTYLYTILEGDDEYVVVNVYSLTDYLEEHREELKQYASRINGIHAISTATDNSETPASATSSPANNSVSSHQVRSPAKSIDAVETASPEERLQNLSKLLKNGLITKDEYNAKKKEILKNL